MKHVSFPWPPLEAALSIFKVNFFVKNNLEAINKNKQDSHKFRIISHLRPSILKKIRWVVQ
jgi:hypothetical protein